MITIKPAAEFRTWLIVVFALSIAAGSLNWGISLMGGWTSYGQVVALLVVLWSLIGFGEGWVQFEQAGRRCLWSLAGALSIVCVMIPFETPLNTWSLLVLMIPATIEFLAARSSRRRPWMWLIATPVLYYSGQCWDYDIGSAAAAVVEFFWRTFNLPSSIPTEGAESAAGVGVLLLTRAALGSFVASRKTA